VAAHDDATAQAACRLRRRLDHDLHPTVTVDDLQNVEALQPDETITAVAVGVSGAGIRT
jgi:hypothetical protein